MSEFYSPKTSVNIKKSGHALESPGIRVYCEQAAERWALQVRGPLLLADGKPGGSGIIAHARLNRDDMVALIEALQSELRARS